MNPARRFNPDDLGYLARAGWFPGRDVGPEVDTWLAGRAEVLADLVPSTAAVAFLREFGGLTLVPEDVGRPIPNAAASILYPVDQMPPALGCFALREEYQLETFPIGYLDDQFSPLAMDSGGRVFLVHWSGDFYLGRQDRALSCLIAAVPGYPIDRSLLLA